MEKALKKRIVEKAIDLISTNEIRYSCYAIAQAAEDIHGDAPDAAIDALNEKWLHNEGALVGYYKSIKKHLESNHPSAIFKNPAFLTDYEAAKEFRLKLMLEYLESI